MLSTKCSKCHHEWVQVYREPLTCDWCGSPDSRVMEELPSTPIFELAKRLAEELKPHKRSKK